MTVKHLKIGARGSPLSLAQTNLIADSLKTNHPDLTCEIIVIKTTGDRFQNILLTGPSNKGLFVKEIEESLLTGAIDLAVHSAKDLPATLPQGLILGAVPPRTDFRDVFVSRHPGGLAGLPAQAVLGTSSLRRAAQLLHRHPVLNLQIIPLRGNVATRLAKATTELDGTLIAAAGLQRLGLRVPGAVFLTPEEMLPAAGQGILALEFRADDNRTKKLLAPLHHRPTAFCLAAERSFLNLLKGGCQLPAAALATYQEPNLKLEALIADTNGRRLIRNRKIAEVSILETAIELGRTLASDLLNRGGADILKNIKEREPL